MEVLVTRAVEVATWTAGLLPGLGFDANAEPELVAGLDSVFDSGFEARFEAGTLTGACPGLGTVLAAMAASTVLRGGLERGVELARVVLIACTSRG